MTPLRQRMLSAMIQRGFALRTQESYVEAVARMAKYYWRDPALLSATEVQEYLLYLRQERHLSYSTVNQAASASRFLYEAVLGQERDVHQPEFLGGPFDQHPADGLLIEKDDGVFRSGIVCAIVLKLHAKLHFDKSLCLGRVPCQGRQLVASGAGKDLQEKIVIAGGGSAQSHWCCLNFI